jgi:putative addiction module component (TIGR02574 family)
MNLHSVYNQALGLSDADRIELAGLVLSSVDVAEQQAVRQAWMEEVDRRREEFLRGRVQAVPYEEVMRAAKARVAL